MAELQNCLRITNRRFLKGLVFFFLKFRSQCHSHVFSYNDTVQSTSVEALVKFYEGSVVPHAIHHSSTLKGN